MKNYIKRLNWDEKTYRAINNLIAKHGIDNPAYDPNKRPFAVFDWDNTSIIGDVEEALLYYMITNLSFKMEVDEFFDLIIKNVDRNFYDDKYNNLENKRLNIDLIAYDIKKAYEFLYKRLDKFGGNQSLDELRKSDYYKEFVTKMFYRYRVSDYDRLAKDPYCWMSFLLKNYKTQEVEALCKDAYEAMRKEKIRVENFTSPAIESKAGRVSIDYFVGIRPLPEMVDLYQTFEENGIDTYIVSASFIDVVRAFASDEDNFYKLNKKKVLGLRLERDLGGKILPSLDKTYPISIREGKVETIDKLIKNATNYGPIMVGGDSDGDLAMLTSYDLTEISLIIHRENYGLIDELRKKAWDGSNRFYSQGRNLLEGKFIASDRSCGYNE